MTHTLGSWKPKGASRLTSDLDETSRPPIANLWACLQTYERKRAFRRRTKTCFKRLAQNNEIAATDFTPTSKHDFSVLSVCGTTFAAFEKKLTFGFLESRLLILSRQFLNGLRGEKKKRKKTQERRSAHKLVSSFHSDKDETTYTDWKLEQHNCNKRDET